MSLVNYRKNDYIYKLFLLCAMNYSRCFIYVILVITHKNSHENKKDIIISVLQKMVNKCSMIFLKT